MQHPMTLVTLAQDRQLESALQAARLRVVQQACAAPSRQEEGAARRRLPAIHIWYARLRRHAWSAIHG